MKHISALIAIFCLLWGFTATCAADDLPMLEYTWPTIDQPFHQSVKIPLYGTASVNVDIDKSFIEENSTVILKMVVDTPFRAIGAGISSGFRFLDPYVSVNGKKAMGVYRLRFTVEGDKNRYIAYAKIKTRHLHPGVNNLRLFPGIQNGVSYHCPNGANCIAVYVFEMMFESGSK